MTLITTNEFTQEVLGLVDYCNGSDDPVMVGALSACEHIYKSIISNPCYLPKASVEYCDEHIYKRMVSIRRKAQIQFSRLRERYGEVDLIKTGVHQLLSSYIETVEFLMWFYVDMVRKAKKEEFRKNGYLFV